MDKKQIALHLESIYLDYYDGLYTEYQLKMILKKLYKEVNIDINTWSEMILDAQWKYASEKDYDEKRMQLQIEAINEKSGVDENMFYCSCGGLLVVKDIEKYSADLKPKDQLEFERKCEVECMDCGKIFKGLKYD